MLRLFRYSKITSIYSLKLWKKLSKKAEQYCLGFFVSAQD